VSHSTLILNADAQPVSLVPISSATWQESIKLVFVDRANVLSEYADWQVHSPSTTMNVPSVIMLRDYIKVRRTIKFSKENIYLRDRYTCQYCGSDFFHDTSQLTMDHVIPRYHGGRTNYTNITSACYSCNLEKAHQLLRPKVMPRRPTYWELAATAMTLPLVVPDYSWLDFLGWDAKLVTVREPHKS
jgi:5-methylcytosine-specific restriction endonuclease McrA